LLFLEDDQYWGKYARKQVFPSSSWLFLPKKLFKEEYMNWKHIALEMEYLTKDERILLNQLRFRTSEKLS
jgi:hypothetical protein